MRRWSGASVLVALLLVTAGCVTVAPAASPTGAPSIVIPTRAPATPSPAVPTPEPTAEQTAVPSALPTAAPTDAATAAPTDAATAAPTAAPSLEGLDPAEAILALLVPEGFRGTCESEEGPASALASIECFTEFEGNNVRVTYSQFAFPEDVDAAYEDALSYLRIEERDQGSCAETWPAEGTYTIAGVTAGRIACAVVPEFPAGDLESIAWTNDSLRVYALVQGYSEITQQQLLDFWTGAGPISGGPAPSPAPTSAPTESEGPFPTAEESALLERIPEAFRAECSRYSLGAPEAALAGIECPVETEGGSMTVSYFQWPSAEAMDEGYGNNLEFMGVTRDQGDCTETWPAEGTYSIGGETAGRVACGLLGGVVPMIAWTDDQLLISVLAEGFGPTQEQMYAWWQGDSGPVR